MTSLFFHENLLGHVTWKLQSETYILVMVLLLAPMFGVTAGVMGISHIGCRVSSTPRAAFGGCYCSKMCSPYFEGVCLTHVILAPGACGR